MYYFVPPLPFIRNSYISLVFISEFINFKICLVYSFHVIHSLSFPFLFYKILSPWSYVAFPPYRLSYYLNCYLIYRFLQWNSVWAFTQTPFLSLPFLFLVQGTWSTILYSAILSQGFFLPLLYFFSSEIIGKLILGYPIIPSSSICIVFYSSSLLWGFSSRPPPTILVT